MDCLFCKLMLTSALPSVTTCAILIKSDNTNMRPGPSGSAVDVGDTCRARDDGRLRRGWAIRDTAAACFFIVPVQVDLTTHVVRDASSSGW